jgi:hypothetical protein
MLDILMNAYEVVLPRFKDSHDAAQHGIEPFSHNPNDLISLPLDLSKEDSTGLLISLNLLGLCKVTGTSMGYFLLSSSRWTCSSERTLSIRTKTSPILACSAMLACSRWWMAMQVRHSGSRHYSGLVGNTCVAEVRDCLLRVERARHVQVLIVHLDFKKVVIRLYICLNRLSALLLLPLLVAVWLDLVGRLFRVRFSELLYVLALFQEV